MPRGSKDKYTDAQKRKAAHIKDSYTAKGVSEDEAEARAWATVNKQSGGGERRGGSGRTKSAAAKADDREASARRAVATRRGIPRSRSATERDEKTRAQLFCDGSATQIIGLLEAECAAGGVAWRMPCEVQRLERHGEEFALETSVGRFAAPALVIATGGLTVPKIGASPFGYRVAAQFGLAVVPPQPANAQH